MSSRVYCCLRTERRLWGLNQQELATLLGCGSATHVSRLEHGERAPTLAVALSVELLFGRAPKDMFCPDYEKTEERLMRRVYAMHKRLAQSGNEADRRKRELLEACLRRAVNRNQ